VQGLQRYQQQNLVLLVGEDYVSYKAKNHTTAFSLYGPKSEISNQSSN